VKGHLSVRSYDKRQMRVSATREHAAHRPATT
jgi:hypothetical protein